MERRVLFRIIGGAILILVVLAAIATFLTLHFIRSEEPVETAAGPKLVIDFDGGADDAMAIFMALLYEKHFHGPHLIALTTNHGNVNESQVFENTQRILNIAKRMDLPIYRGQKSSLVYTFPTDFYFGYDGLGDSDNVEYEAIEAQPDHAVMALIKLSKEYEGELTLVILGPLTNVALAVKLDPDFIGRLAHLYVAAGNIYGLDHPDAEFNALVDVESYHIVAEYSRPDKVTFIPFSQILDSCGNVTRDWRENVLGSIPTEIMKNLNIFEQISITTSDFWVMLDPAAMAVVLNDNLITDTKYFNNSIVLCGNRRGVNMNTFTEYADVNVRLVYSVNEELYKQFLYEVFASEL